MFRPRAKREYLFHFPSFAGENHRAEGVEAFACFYLCHLLGDSVFVGGSGDVAYHAEGEGKLAEASC